MRRCAWLAALACLTAPAIAQEPAPKPAETAEASAPAAAHDAKAKPAERVVAIAGGDVHVGDGTVLRRATVLIRGKRIEAVGRDVAVPEGAERIDASGRVVCPGFIAVRAIGFGAPRAFGTDEIADSVNPFDPTIELGLAVGITAFGAFAEEGRDTPGGKSAVLKLTPGDLAGMVCKAGHIASMAVPLDPKQWKAFREAVGKAKEHRAKLAEAAGKKDARSPKAPREAEPYLRLLGGEQILWVRSRAGPLDTPKLQDALEIARVLGRPVVLDHPITAWAFAKEIAATGSIVVLQPRQRVPADPDQPDTTGTNFAAPQILAAAGVPIAVTAPSVTLSLDGLLGQDLNTPAIDAAFAVRGGLDDRRALRTLTLDAARALGVEDRIGSLESGKDADVLILDGDPLHYRTLVETVLVDGKVVYERANRPFYSNIKR